MYFREVGSDVIFVINDLTKNVEEENTHILVKVLMVKEKLGEEGQVFTIYWVFVTIYFKNG